MPKKHEILPELKRFYENPLLANMPKLEETPIFKIREFYDTIAKLQRFPISESDVVVTNGNVTTSYGDLLIRTYRPKVSGPLPTLIFFHGGGFVFGNLETTDGHCREIAFYTESVVISVDYPLAPENRFPIPVEASFEAVCKLSDDVEGDLYIGGSSAGATLSAVIAVICRDQNGPELSGQILLYPLCDTNFNTQSHKEMGKDFNLTTKDCEWFCTQYARSLKDYQDPKFAPSQTENLSYLPKALVVTAEFDPLCDDGRLYAKRLKEAGVEVTDFSYEGTVHGFSTLPLKGFAQKEDVLVKMRSFMKCEKSLD